MVPPGLILMPAVGAHVRRRLRRFAKHGELSWK
jgi:hypothetical protein